MRKLRFFAHGEAFYDVYWICFQREKSLSLALDGEKTEWGGIFRLREPFTDEGHSLSIYTRKPIRGRTRIVVDGKAILRLDIEPAQCPDPPAFTEAPPNAPIPFPTDVEGALDGIILCDYGKGAISHKDLMQVAKARAAGTDVFVNTKRPRDFSLMWDISAREANLVAIQPTAVIASDRDCSITELSTAFSNSFWIYTCGKSGIIYGRRKIIRGAFSPEADNVANTIGAGDYFTAHFAMLYTLERDFSSAARAAAQRTVKHLQGRVRCSTDEVTHGFHG